ncbi:uncharacterized protein LOC123508515 [Portunus trituberculatus]|uniref:uncharacterized protein LOC123508515 n=1 Tax=Portunus trituberculatus TaxID=210409 RepID=UPI001E1D011A|nr:uncharacterized protein LOC123508515 [Portunus trituberculatus]
MANCSSILDFVFSDEVPHWLLHLFITYCYAVCFLGLFCNAVAVWCVAGCPRTRPAVKMLLCALFSSTLLVCLLVVPYMVYLGMSKLWCVDEVKVWVFLGMMGIMVILMELEVYYILVLAVLRTVAVWSPLRHQVKLRTSVALVVGVAVFVTATTAAMLALPSASPADTNIFQLTSLVLTVLHYFLPMVITLACYCSMIFVVRRNKRRLAVTPDTAGTGQMMDQATRAMLAVFISNMLLSTPQFVCAFLFYTPNLSQSNIFVVSYIIFFTHLFVDPLVFVCFNLHHRQRVLQALKSCLQWVTCRPRCVLPHATSTLPLHSFQKDAHGSYVFWNIFNGTIPDPLIQFFIFYCVVVCFFGLLCNVVVLWCVAGCSKTRRAVKVLLCALFCTLLLCLLVMPFMAHVAMSKLWCGLQVNMWLIQGFLFVYVILTEMELFFILVMAFLRTIAVWSPQRHQVKQRTSLALVMGVALYSIAITSALMVPYWVDIVDESTAIIIARVLSVTHYFLPVLLTLACYSSMIFVIRRNKCRLAATPDTAETGQVMDQATRAMLAVFISNLLFGLPHSIYHILSYPGHVVPRSLTRAAGLSVLPDVVINVVVLLPALIRQCFVSVVYSCFASKRHAAFNECYHLEYDFVALEKSKTKLKHLQTFLKIPQNTPKTPNTPPKTPRIHFQTPKTTRKASKHLQTPLKHTQNSPSSHEGQTRMANCTVTYTRFNGDIPDSLLYFFIIYCSAVCLVGTLCNVVVLRCVVGCSRTPPAVKILLCALFSSTLLMCLLVMPFMAHVGVSKARCDGQIPIMAIRVVITIYIILTEMELLYISLMALLRAIAVWSPTKRELKIPAAVALLVGILIYSTVMTLLLLAAFWYDIVSGYTGFVLAQIYNSINFLAPVVFTIACYLSMLLAVRRNQHRLAATPDTAATSKVMDQATRAMLAVFISNLLLGLPHSIYHLLPRYDNQVFSYVTMHIIFFTHLFVDPLVFVFFNIQHRQRVLQALKMCMQCVTCRQLSALPHATSTLPLHLTSSSSSSSLQQQRERT